MERRKYTREFKLEAVKLIKERGVTVAQAARDLGVHAAVLHNWVRHFAIDPEVADGVVKMLKLTPAQAAEVRDRFRSWKPSDEATLPMTTCPSNIPWWNENTGRTEEPPPEMPGLTKAQ